MQRISGLGALVLCGGQSSRMGTSKAWLMFDGEPLLLRVLRRIAEVAAPLVVVAAPGQALPALPEGVEVARDSIAGLGPLQGMAAGFEALSGRAAAAFVSSTDVPFLHPAFMRRLHALRGESHDIVVPRAGGHYHPLSAVYGLSAAAEIRALLAADRRRPFFLFERMHTRVVEPAELLADDALRAADPGLLSLENVNTPGDLAGALARIRR